MPSGAQTVAKCVAEWLYQQGSSVLQALRSLLEKAILMIDAQIMWLRAQIAMWDPTKYLEEYIWGTYEALIEKIKNSILGALNGLGPPGADLCPEFYHYITDPLMALLEGSLSAFSIYKDRYFSIISLTSNFDRLLVYWTATKAQLEATLDVLDDALYNALINEAVNAVP